MHLFGPRPLSQDTGRWLCGDCEEATVTSARLLLTADGTHSEGFTHAVKDGGNILLMSLALALVFTLSYRLNVLTGHPSEDTQIQGLATSFRI